MSDTIFVAEVFDSDAPLAAPVDRRFFALVVAAGWQARHPDNQVYLELQAEGGTESYDYEGITLQAMREAFVAGQPGVAVRSPFHQAADGRLRCYTEDQLGAELLRRDTECAHNVQLAKLFWHFPANLHSDDITDFWVSSGIDTAVPSVVVLAGSVGVADPRVVADPSFDFMADLILEARREKRQRGQPLGDQPMAALANEIDEFEEEMAALIGVDAHGAYLQQLIAHELAQEAVLDDQYREDAHVAVGAAGCGSSGDDGVAAGAEDDPAGSDPSQEDDGTDVVEQELDYYQALFGFLGRTLSPNNICKDRVAGKVVGVMHRFGGSLKATC